MRIWRLSLRGIPQVYWQKAPARATRLGVEKSRVVALSSGLPPENHSDREPPGAAGRKSDAPEGARDRRAIRRNPLPVLRTRGMRFPELPVGQGGPAFRFTARSCQKTGRRFSGTRCKAPGEKVESPVFRIPARPGAL
jgi:hypothetical protein